METGRELFIRIIKGESLPRPPFAPLLWGVLARIEGKPLKELISEPTLWANSLQKAVELFGFEGVVTGFNFSLMAEACGCTLSWEDDQPVPQTPPTELCQTPEKNGLMKHALEAAARVFQVSRNERACMVALTGPVTLATQLFGQEKGPDHISDTKQLVVRVTEAFCKIRPDLLLFMEENPLTSTEINTNHCRAYNTLKNITSYYNIPCGIYFQGYQHHNLEQFSKLKMDFYIPGLSEDNNLPALSELWNLGTGALGVGVSLPLDDLSKVRKIIQQWIDLYQTEGKPRFFFTSYGPVSRDVNLDLLHQVTKEINQLRL